MLDLTRHVYKEDELTNAIKTILSTTQPLTRSAICIKLGARVTTARVRIILNHLVENGEVLKFSGHPDTFLKSSADGSVYFSIRGKPRIRG